MLVVAGIDVGKDSLEVCVDGPGRFDNSSAGIRVLKWIGKEHDVSGEYERPAGMSGNWSDSWTEAGLIPRMVHPFRMRSLARARGFDRRPTVSTHRSLYGHTFPMAAQRGKPDPERAELRDLLRRRRQLVNQRVQELNRLQRDHERQQGLHQTAHSLAG